MLVHCPSCQASYRLDAATLGGGRTVRCARCRAQWFVAATPERIEAIDGDEVAIDAVDMAVPETLDAKSSEFETLEAEIVEPAVRPAAGRAGRSPLSFRGRSKSEPAGPRLSRQKRLGSARRRTFVRRLRPSAAFAALGVALIGFAVAEPAAMVRAAPSLGRLYAAVGMEVNVRGLAVRDVKSIEDVEDGVPILLVTGSIENVSAADAVPPRLRLAIRAADGRELYVWTAVAGRARLAPGEAAPFRARLASPPAEGRAVAVRFLAPRDAATRSRGRDAP